MKKPPSLPAILFTLGVIIFIVAGFYFYQVRDADVREPYKKISEVVYNELPGGEVWQVVEGIKEKLLKDPDSYESVHWYQVVQERNGNFSVRHRFRARKPGGGYEDPVTLKFFITPAGKVLDVK